MLVTISLVKQTQNEKVTRKILEREKKKKTETKNMGRGKLDLISFREFMLLRSKHLMPAYSLFLFLLDIMYLT